MTNARQRVNPNAANPYVAPTLRYGVTGRFDEGEVAPVKPRRGSLLYMKRSFAVGCACGLAVAVGLVSGSAYAGNPKVVCWYHFDEAASGTVTTASSQILNAVTGDGVAPAGSCWSVDSSMETTQSGSVMPIYGEGFPFGAQVYDPLTGSFFANGRAMRFTPDGNTGAFVKISNSDNWLPSVTDTYTVECFYRWDGPTQGSGRPIYVPILSSYNSSGSLNWVVRLNQNNGSTPGCITVQFRTATGEYAWHANIPGAADSKMDDGRWHHFAFQYVSSNEVKVYFDYVQVVDITGQNFSCDGDGSVFVGSTPYMTYGRFDGLIDEVRITKGLLSSDQFLTYQNVIADLPSDVAVLVNFDPFPTNWMAAMDVSSGRGANLAPSTGPAFAKTVIYAGSGFSGDSLPGASVRQSFCTTNATENLEAFVVKTNASSKTSSGCVVIDDRAKRLTDTSFTVEMDVRCDGNPLISSDSWYLFCSPDIKLRMMSGKDFNMYGTGYANWKNYGGYDIRDGQWHHVAMVYDLPASNVTVYVDYFVACTATYAIPVPAAASSYYTGIGAGCWADYGYNLAAGAYDNIRVTRRKLEPHEFLTAHCAPYGSVSMWMGFDGDLASFVCTSLIRNPSTGAFVDGGTVDYTTNCRGKQMLNADGNVLKDNVKAMVVDGGKAQWSASSAICYRDFTVEMFYRMATPNSFAGILERTWSGSANNPIWAIRVRDKNGPEIWVKDPEEHSVAFPSGHSYFDGHWHHLAASFKTVGENTEIKMYFDYEHVGTSTVSGSLVSNLSSSFLVGVACSGHESAALNGILDEIRIHNAVVGPEAFLRPSKTGMILIFR